VVAPGRERAARGFGARAGAQTGSERVLTRSPTVFWSGEMGGVVRVEGVEGERRLRPQEQNKKRRTKSLGATALAQEPHHTPRPHSAATALDEAAAR